jgi:hypothetical protein
MRRRGVTYDVGHPVDGQDSRPDLRWDEVARELEIIRQDLHGTAVKIHSADLDRLARAGELALDAGLEAWLAPQLWERGPDETHAYIVAAAAVGERRHRSAPGRVFLSVAGELSLMMPGILPGATVYERIAHCAAAGPRTEEQTRRLDEVLGRAVAGVRGVFAGRLTYAALPWERVDWARFDFVGVDLYRDEAIRDRYPRIVERICARGRPVIVAEFGCCGYAGAQRLGGAGWDIFDHAADPPRLAGDYARDEPAQAREIVECLRLFDAAGVDGAFVHTFVSPLNPANADPRFDFDLGSYALVRSGAGRVGDLAARHPAVPWRTASHGEDYRGLPWAPKLAFHAVAGAYASAS